MPRARCVSHATLIPLGQPEKAMGHESPIEPWLAPDNRCCLWSPNRLASSRAKVMKTTGKENQKRCENRSSVPRSRNGRPQQSCSTRWAGSQAKIQPKEKSFLLDSFYRTYQDLTAWSVDNFRFADEPRRSLHTTAVCRLSRMTDYSKANSLQEGVVKALHGSFGHNGTGWPVTRDTRFDPVLSFRPRCVAEQRAAA